MSRARILALAGIVLAAGAIILGNQRPVHAQTVPSGSEIVCYVFSELNSIGTPIPFLDASGCPSEPPSGSATIRVMKVVSGGSASASDFSVHLKLGASEVGGSPQPGSVAGTSYIWLEPGTYTVSETGGPAGYTASFSMGCNASGSIEVAAGNTKVCVVTNTFQEPAPSTGAIQVVKVVAGGTATSSDFQIHVLQNGTDIAGSPQAGTAAGTSYTGLSAGSYVVGETGGPAHYTPSFSGACNGTSTVAVLTGATSTCTITNTYAPPASGDADLSIQKTVDVSAPHPGDQVTYTLTAANAGPATALSVLVTDMLPGGVTYLSDDGAGAYATSTGIWTIGTLSSGSSTALHLSVRVNEGTAGMTITNTASISSGNADPGSGNNDSGVSFVSTDSGGGGSVPPTTSGGGGSVTTGGSAPSRSAGSVLGAATSSPACDTYLTAFIRYGVRNDPEQVRRLQRILKDVEGAAIAVTGTYDGATLAAVHAFQRKYAADILAPWGYKDSTGFVYLTTRKKVNELYCKNAKLFPLTAVQQSEVDAYRTGRTKQVPATPRVARPARQAPAAAMHHEAAARVADKMTKSTHARCGIRPVCLSNTRICDTATQRITRKAPHGALFSCGNPNLAVACH